MKYEDLKIGQFVHYKPAAGKPQNGRIKTILPPEENAARVVYKCDNRWGSYEDFTSELTDLEDLWPGWVVDDA